MIDDTIRSAYETIAATAPGPERVRAALLTRTRVHRQRRALLVGAGALAATATGLPFVLRERHRPPTTGRPAAPQPAAPQPAAPQPVEVPFLFAPAWLPGEVGELFRSVKTTGEPDGGTRIWARPGTVFEDGTAGLRGVTLSVNERIDDNSGSPVMIGSVRGSLRVTDGAFVEWQPPGVPNLIVSVYGLKDATNTALRVARSVARTDAALRLAMRLPWVPQRFAGYTQASVYPIPGGWCQSLVHESADGLRSFAIVARTRPAPEGAAYQTTRPGGVTIYLPPGKQDPEPLTKQEAARLLDELDWTPPDLSWVGRR